MRSPESTKERIACNSYLAALCPDVLPQALDQGTDFGIDYMVQAFDRTGVMARRYDTQVKYISMDSVEFPEFRELFWEWQNALPNDRLTFCRHDLSLSYLAQCLQGDGGRRQTTLFVLANESHLFCMWVEDLYDFYLRWIPQAARNTGTIRVFFNAARSLPRRRRGEQHGSNVESLSMSGVRFGTRFINYDFTPRTVDSLCNLGVSLYLQNSNSKSSLIGQFDVDGYWNFLLDEAINKPWLPVLMARFIGLLRSTVEMVQWAVDVVTKFDCPYSIPVAYQVLSKAGPSPSVNKALGRLYDSIHDATWFRAYCQMLFRNSDAAFEAASHRLLVEYIISVMRALSGRIEQFGENAAQESFVTLLTEISYPAWDGEFIAAELAHLAKKGKFVKGPSLDTLKNLCSRFCDGTLGSDLADAFWELHLEVVDDYVAK